ncbi:MAG: hypothetical protein FJ276_32855 [Planctomycetes bacterium]|nr:hypothetical protein [Planctomycetota bacterium]
MAHSCLEALRNDDFVIHLCFIATPDALHNALGKSAEVKIARTALARGEVTEDSIRQFVAELLDHLQRNIHFPFEIPLAAIAVVLETWNSVFAEDFVTGLSQLERAEMPMSIGVAKRSVRRQKMQSGTNSRFYDTVLGSGKHICTPGVWLIESSESCDRDVRDYSNIILLPFGSRSHVDKQNRSGANPDADARVFFGL